MVWVGCAVVGVVRGAPSCGVGGVCSGGSDEGSHLCGVAWVGCAMAWVGCAVGWAYVPCAVWRV